MRFVLFLHHLYSLLLFFFVPAFLFSYFIVILLSNPEPYMNNSPVLGAHMFSTFCPLALATAMKVSIFPISVYKQGPSHNSDFIGRIRLCSSRTVQYLKQLKFQLLQPVSGLKSESFMVSALFITLFIISIFPYLLRCFILGLFCLCSCKNVFLCHLSFPCAQVRGKVLIYCTILVKVDQSFTKFIVFEAVGIFAILKGNRAFERHYF